MAEDTAAHDRQVGWFATFAGAPFCLACAPTEDVVLRHYEVAEEEVASAIVSPVPFALAYSEEHECEVCGRRLDGIVSQPPGASVGA